MPACCTGSGKSYEKKSCVQLITLTIWIPKWHRKKQLENLNTNWEKIGKKRLAAFQARIIKKQNDNRKAQRTTDTRKAWNQNVYHQLAVVMCTGFPPRKSRRPKCVRQRNVCHESGKAEKGRNRLSNKVALTRTLFVMWNKSTLWRWFPAVPFLLCKCWQPNYTRPQSWTRRYYFCTSIRRPQEWL